MERLNIAWIHGHCESPDVFRPLLERIGLDFNHTLITLPGCDMSLFPQKIQSITDVARIIQRQIPEGSVLLGHSLGGYIALSLAELYPNAWKGLILLHSTPYQDTSARVEKRLQVLRLLETHGAEAFYPLFAESLFYRPHPAKDLVLEISRRTPGHVVAAYTRMMMNRTDHLETLISLTIPALVISGANDPILPLHQFDELKKLMPEQTLHLLNDCGHMGMYECPDTITTVLQNWLNGTLQAS